ncbi:VOC family protein [Flavobacterium kingsejongi]|nr:VOC family protein [Flavobacterium kingsejongi]
MKASTLLLAATLLTVGLGQAQTIKKTVMNDTTALATMGFSRANHVGIVTSNLDASIRFYEALTGKKAAPQDKIGGKRMAGVLGLDKALIRYATIHLDNLNIDLLQYEAPEPSKAQYANNQIGAMHLCFEVDNIDDAVARLCKAGIRLQGDPITFMEEDGLKAGFGTAVAYFDDPDGTHLEIIAPQGPFKRTGN